MEARKLTKDEQSAIKVSFAEGLRRISSERITGKFTEREKKLFEKVKLVEETSERRSFVLGRQVD